VTETARRAPRPAVAIHPAPENPRPSEAKAHAYAREHGVSRALYAIIKTLASVALRSWFRVHVSGREHVPAHGPAIITPNHKSSLDPFFIGIATERRIRYMAKAELFRGPLAWLLPRLGAFPVCRGETDREALETSRAILHAGGVVVVFPEGTRVEETDALGSPHHGAGRLALETGTPIVPVAITGTSELWRAPLPKVRRVQLTFLPAVQPPASGGRDAVHELIDERVWPGVREEYRRLRAKPGLIACALLAIGIGGGLLARRRLEAKRQPRMLGLVAPRKVRRRTARERPRAHRRSPRG
jgi:1-acyl-sn-glycerol-3-phosphate acyltransferase